MNFEDKIISFKPKPLIEDPDKMEYLLNKVKISEQKRPQIESFKDIYSEGEIENDKLLIKKREDEWRQKEDDFDKFVRNFSLIYETAVIDILDTNKYLGEKSRVIYATKFDDIFNGIDGVLVVEGKEQDQHLGLNMDVTFSAGKNIGGDDILEKKIESIKQCIRKGVLPTLKYFQNPKTMNHEQISLPKIIIGSQQESADGLIRLWGETSRTNNEKLKNHPIQSKVIMEAIYQLRYFYEFAKNLSENTREDDMREKYEEIYIKYAQMYNYFYDVYLKNKDLIESHYNEILNDVVYRKIVNLTGGII